MTIHIPTPLRTSTSGSASVVVEGATVAAALESLVTLHPGLRPNLFDKEGNIRSFVNLYLNDEDVRYLPAKDSTPVQSGDELTIIPSIAGGL